MTFVCAPLASLPRRLPRDDRAIALYDRPTQVGMGSAGTSLLGHCRKAGIEPVPRAWDFLSLALAALAADQGMPRQTSSDGWTRELAIQVAVMEPDFWNTQTAALEAALCFLTGDRWRIAFSAGGELPAKPKKRADAPEEMICLLSGGLDSLVGIVDLAAQGQRPLAVSQIAQGDMTHQSEFARLVGGGLRHLQLNHLVRPLGPAERSQRARSIIFLAYGVLAATSLDIYRDGRRQVDLIIPENGYISLNIPLTPLRLGSLSTRTTHPIYLQTLQSVLDAAALRVTLKNPYQFKTQGAMLAECEDQPLLTRLATRSTSCGRFARNAFTHCGRCVPCMIRRAAFHHWGARDRTTYVYGNLALADSKHRNFEDVRAASIAVQRVVADGLEAWIGASLSSHRLSDRARYLDVAGRGLEEVATFLRARNVL